MQKPDKKIIFIGESGIEMLANWEDWLAYCDELEQSYKLLNQIKELLKE